ncbi:MAG: hypothetical protein AAFZ07_04245 [Actinomycetota bacterium]
MNDVETRLRAELPELADVLLDARRPASARETDGEVEQISLRDEVPAGRSRLPVAAALLVVALVAGLLAWRGPRTSTEPAADVGDEEVESALAVTGPAGPGTWEPIAAAPIAGRSFAVAGWIGGEVVVWAGSNPDRDVAYADGAAYDPSTDSWRTLVVPGWGHPGLTSVVVDGRLVALAKGAVTSIDPRGDGWTELPDVEGALLGQLVSDGEDLFGIGAVQRPEASSIAVVRYDDDAEVWVRGTDLPLAAEAVSWDQLWRLMLDVVWADGEIVVWDDGRGSAYDPARDTWRSLPPLEHPDGRIGTSKIVGHDSGLVVVASVVEPSGRTSYRLARPDGDGWTWARPLLPTVDLEEVSIASAGDWIVLFEPQLPPVTVHVDSGAWDVHLDGPLGGLEGAVAVWTGTELIVWGGVGSPTSTVPAPASGARWTPPSLDGP